MFGERVKALRKEKGMTQQELANIVGVTKGTVALWEQGQRNPSLAVVNRLAEYFDKKVDYVLGNSDDSSPLHDDYDYLGLSSVGDNLNEVLGQFLRLDEYGRAAVEALIKHEYYRCAQQKTLLTEDENAFRVSVMMKEDIIAKWDAAPHRGGMAAASADEDFA